MGESSRRRLQLIAALLGLAALFIIATLINMQVFKHQFYKEWGEDVRSKAIPINTPPRGTITDRNGHVLAGNAVAYTLQASPREIPESQVITAAIQLGEILARPSSEIEPYLRWTGDPDFFENWPQRNLNEDEEEDRAPWIRIEKYLSKEVGEQINDLQLPGISLKPIWERRYPEGELASHLLGFRAVEDETGFYGVEGFYDSFLRSTSITPEIRVDPQQRPVPWEVTNVELPEAGGSLVLTIDRTIQAIVEAELENSIEAYQAEGGTIIVMNPQTFEILASASRPTYNPAQTAGVDDPKRFVDPAIGDTYEPGSVFKPLTVAAALDSGVVTEETTFVDNGVFEVGGHEIRNALDQTYGEQTITDILIHSINTGAAWLSTQMGTDTFYSYVQAFGIGDLTEVDLEGEVVGELPLPGDYDEWYDSNLGTNSFGQGLTVTPLQMITAIATIANDGTRLKPYVVVKKIEGDGDVLVSEPQVEAQVVSPQTARTVTEMLVRTVDEGVTQAQVEGYRIAGKSGTAEIPVPGGYIEEGTIASFVGYGPIPDPEVVILVKLDRPQTSRWGGDTAARSFRRLAQQLFTILGIPPSGTGVAEANR